jgi:hypothetical protein
VTATKCDGYAVTFRLKPSCSRATLPRARDHQCRRKVSTTPAEPPRRKSARQFRKPTADVGQAHRSTTSRAVRAAYSEAEMVLRTTARNPGLRAWKPMTSKALGRKNWSSAPAAPMRACSTDGLHAMRRRILTLGCGVAAAARRSLGLLFEAAIRLPVSAENSSAVPSCERRTSIASGVNLKPSGGVNTKP